METKEILQLLSDNHRLLMLLGGLLSFISLFLPSFTVNAIRSYSYVTISGLSYSLSDTEIFWVYLIVIIGLYIGYLLGYGEKYPYLYLAIGVFLLLITFYATQMSGQLESSVSYGFFLELIGSLAVAVGGYYYYETNKTDDLTNTGKYR